MSTNAAPDPTYPAARLGDPSEPATWEDLPTVVPGHNRYVDWTVDNSRRASWAAAALRPYGELVMPNGVTETPEVILSDLLADLRHLADAMGIDFDHAYGAACGHYYLDLTGRPV